MRTGFVALAIGLVAAPVFAQPAQLTNAQVRVMKGGALRQTVDEQTAATAAVGWIAYAVPMLRGDRMLCDWTEGSHRTPPTAVKLEGPDTLFVFLRVESRALTRVRMFSEGCAIDAGGVPVVWLEGAQPAQSVSLLASLVDPARPRRVADGALAALAMHADATAATALVAAAKNGASAQVRGHALFWVAQRAGAEAIPTIAEAIERDPDTDVKKRAVFALSQLPANEGVPKLIEVASSHSNPAVRKQAMFWLGQSKDPRALAFFERILLSR
jgi:HEAT repeat protein